MGIYFGVLDDCTRCQAPGHFHCLRKSSASRLLPVPVRQPSQKYRPACILVGRESFENLQIIWHPPPCQVPPTWDGNLALSYAPPAPGSPLLSPSSPLVCRRKRSKVSRPVGLSHVFAPREKGGKGSHGV